MCTCWAARSFRKKWANGVEGVSKVLRIVKFLKLTAEPLDGTYIMRYNILCGAPHATLAYASLNARGGKTHVRGTDSRK